MNGLAAKMLALTTLRMFDGRMVSFAQVVDLRVRSRLLRGVVSIFAGSVNGKRPLRRGRCFIELTNPFERGFSPCGL
jgi:uncharacterized protein YqhQ